ncbi:uncharacterized protein JCM6883_003329 [Sporobolomyces salmoneus]|uniref:uncharacterized protein n=1 Tax=Sporobolomyces salmoneus TaxID=183962 RepID=UPI00316D167E
MAPRIPKNLNSKAPPTQDWDALKHDPSSASPSKPSGSSSRPPKKSQTAGSKGSTSRNELGAGEKRRSRGLDSNLASLSENDGAFDRDEDEEEGKLQDQPRSLQICLPKFEKLTIRFSILFNFTSYFFQPRKGSRPKRNRSDPDDGLEEQQEIAQNLTEGLQWYLQDVKNKMFKPGTGEAVNTFFATALSIWSVFVNVIVRYAHARFALVDGFLVPKGGWSSRSHHPKFFEKVEVNDVLLNGKKQSIVVSWGQVAFAYMYATSGDAVRKLFDGLNDTNWEEWYITGSEIKAACPRSMIGSSLRGVYGLGIPSGEIYPGMTGTTFHYRAHGHELSGPNAELDFVHWSLWDKFIIWNFPEPDQLAHDLFGYYVEFVSNVALRSTIHGLSTNYLDTCNWAAKVNTKWVRNFIDQVRVILDANPGLKIGTYFIAQQGLDINSPLAAATLENILYGITWQWFVRDLGVLKPSDYPSGRLPKGLQFSGEQQARSVAKVPLKYISEEEDG